MQSVKEKVWELALGARYLGEERATFTVWAPHHTSLSLEIAGRESEVMERGEEGYFTLTTTASPGEHYFYRFENGRLRPDPVSRFLPEGVHGPTEIVDPAYRWHDQGWEGIELGDAIIYELHVGTFSRSGTFEGVCEKLDHLASVGVNMIELMPIAQFPGKWNWGYDGASLYAPSALYGGPQGLKRLVDLCHERGIAVCLDVVYNHFGPEGNYLAEFGPYFHHRYHTPWGQALNYDGEHNDAVRRYIVENAFYWVHEYHIDMLRLDAIHGIFDFSASEMLRELASTLPIPLVGENERNDWRYLRSQEIGGWGFAGMWNDDFHHAVHAYLTGERHIYYADFGSLDALAKCYDKGVVYDGNYSPFRKMRHGNTAEGIPYEKFISFTQNHDQIGNRPFGERLSTLLPLEKVQIAAVLNLLSPMTPMLFMGEEYGEEAPFDYFVDFTDENLMESIYEGRMREFHSPHMPFPGKESFDKSRLTWKTEENGLLEMYRKLIALRKEHLPRKGITAHDVDVHFGEKWLAFSYPTRKGDQLAICALFKPQKIAPPVPLGELLFATQQGKFEGQEWECAYPTALVFLSSLSTS